MKIIIVGCGKIGQTLTDVLAEEGHELVIVDEDPEVLGETESRNDVLCVEGNGANVSVLEKAGVPKGDLLIAVTDADETNILACMVARRLGCKRTIARTRNPEYSRTVTLLRDTLGLSMTVNPERKAAAEITRILRYPSFLKRDSFAKGRAEIVELPVTAGSRLDGETLMHINGLLKDHVLVCAVARGDEVFIPGGSFQLKAGDHIYVTAPTQTLLNLTRLMGIKMPGIRNVMLVGGSNISVFLSQMLTASGISVKLVEKDKERCAELATLLPEAEIVHGDGAHFATLQSEGIEETDAFIALTDMDELNMLISMYANRLKVPKVITKINRTGYRELLPASDSQTVVSPRALTGSDILRYVRAMENRSGGMVTLHRLVNERVEALEFKVTDATLHTGVPLRELSIKKNILVALIANDNGVSVPNGLSSFMPGDMVTVVTTADRHINDLNDIFEE